MPIIEPVRDAELANCLDEGARKLWQRLVQTIDSLYDMEKVWYDGGKQAIYELKFRRGGKTLVSLFARQDAVALMVIFGKAEREKFESNMESFSAKTVQKYHDATTYHDGKWILFDLPDAGVEEDLPALLAIKRRPNRK